MVLEPIASSQAVLTEEEKEVGIALIDIGGGTTDIAIFEENIIRYTAVFGIAGRQVTDDVRKVLGIVVSQAERIKREYGHCYEPSIMKDEVIMIPGISGRKPMEITKRHLCQIIQPRMEEIFEFALAEIRRSGYEHRLGAGIVITGGATLIRGADELAQKIFNLPVKIGYPSGISYMGLAPEVESPVYSTSVGLSLYGIDKNKSEFDAMEITTDASVMPKEKPQQVPHPQAAPAVAEPAKPIVNKEHAPADKQPAPAEADKTKTKGNKPSVLNQIKGWLQEL